MKCRKNLRVLFAEYNSASPADRPATALMRLKTAILALKNPALHPSLLISRPDVAAAIVASGYLVYENGLIVEAGKAHRQ